MHRFGRLKDAEKCTHCGYCLPVCPTYRAENVEMQSPRGRVSAILALMDGRLSPEETGRALSACLGCRACHRACPAGVQVGKLVLLSRSHAPMDQPWPIRLLHLITDRDPPSRILQQWVQWYQRSRWRRWCRKQGWLMKIELLRRLDTLIPEYHPPVSAMAAIPAIQGEPIKAALLCGCMGRLFYPNVKDATSALLCFLGVELLTLDGFGCCGAPHRQAGNRRAFLRQAKKVLDRFRPMIFQTDVVLCDSAICRVTALSYARSLANDPDYADLAREFCNKIVDITYFIRFRPSLAAAVSGRTSRQRIAFFDHCQTRHESEIISGLRGLVAALGVDWTELTPADQCCGAGGDMMLSHSQMSTKIRQHKLDAIKGSGAEVVVGTNPGCLMNIEAGLKADHAPVRVCHLVEILWETVRSGSPKSD
ncbi:MAG: (Fe-S)-binding protein [Magnetococcales bacterium]|nr:(Fe-S)-binding protein [Magnetococcales bacterium]